MPGRCPSSPLGVPGHLPGRGQGEGCDQIYTLGLATGATRLVSVGQGRTTCSYYYPAGDRILWEFNLFMVNLDGSGLKQITFAQGFDGFPMFSPDGKYLVWGSNRNESHPGNTNVFIAEWVENPGG